jgi:hypothetical protein
LKTELREIGRELDVCEATGRGVDRLDRRVDELEREFVAVRDLVLS